MRGSASRPRRTPAIALAIVLAIVLAGLPLSPAAAGAAPTPVPVDNHFPGGLYREEGTAAAWAATRLRAAGDPASAALIDRIASQPTAVWLGDWFSDALLVAVIKRHLAAARAQGATPVFVTYAIPRRDCGGFSAGGRTYANYLDWNRTVAGTLAGSKAVVLVEPDSLAMLSNPRCAGEAAKRLPLIGGAVDILAAAGLTTYLDGGNSRWLTPAVQADWLVRAGVARSSGFFTNVSNFNPVQVEQDYAGKVSSRVGFKHFVIDVSRNGPGWTGGWCNPPGASLGENPRVLAGSLKLDALLWVKHPGLSDGSCNGGPPAGQWFEAAALSLARNH